MGEVGVDCTDGGGFVGGGGGDGGEAVVGEGGGGGAAAAETGVGVAVGAGGELPWVGGGGSGWWWWFAVLCEGVRWTAAAGSHCPHLSLFSLCLSSRRKFSRLLV